MSKLVYLRDIGVLADPAIVDRLPAGFYRRFKMHACWAEELYLKYIYKKVKIADGGKINVELTDVGDNPPRHSPGSHFYRWRFAFDEYIHAEEDIKKKKLFDAVHTALIWNATQESWPIEPFQNAYQSAVDDGLSCEGILDRSWMSPCKKFRVRVHVLHELEMIKFSAVLFRNRTSTEIQRVALKSIEPRGVGIQDYVRDGSWISRTKFELRSQSFPQQVWPAEFGNEMQIN